MISLNLQQERKQKPTGWSSVVMAMTAGLLTAVDECVGLHRDVDVFPGQPGSRMVQKKNKNIIPRPPH